MNDELTDLIEAAMLKEVASGAFYTEGQKKTDDPGARALLKELADMERGHLEMLRKLNQRNHPPSHWRRNKAALLRLDYLSGGESLEDAGLQDTLIFAIKQEQKAAEFYYQMKAVFRDEEARRLCQHLIDEENEHQRKLELFYDDFVFAED